MLTAEQQQGPLLRICNRASVTTIIRTVPTPVGFATADLARSARRRVWRRRAPTPSVIALGILVIESGEAGAGVDRRRGGPRSPRRQRLGHVNAGLDEAGERRRGGR